MENTSWPSSSEPIWPFTITPPPLGSPAFRGKDSMKNDYLIGTTKISIPPTVLFSAVSVMTDVRKCVTMDAKRAGDRVYVLGETLQRDGGFRILCPFRLYRKSVPRVDARRPRSFMKRWEGQSRKGWWPPAMTARTGGWGWPWRRPPLVEPWGWNRPAPCSLLGSESKRCPLFSESQSRFVVTVHPENQKRL